MHIYHQWDDPEQILLLRLEDGWTWEEYHSVVAQLSETVRQLNHTVDAIVENTAKIPFPAGSALSNLRQVTRVLPNNFGVIVVVSPNPFVKTINNILMQLAPKLRETIALADTREEAYAIVVERRAQRGSTVK